MHNEAFLHTVYPLFEQGRVAVVEWSFDMINKAAGQTSPAWIEPLLHEYATAGRLLAHGVHFSLFEAKWTPRQTQWMQQLESELAQNRYTHISEHFAFMTSQNYHNGFPLPVPLNADTLAIGIDRLMRIQRIAQMPVGVENLAFAFDKQSVQAQARFMSELIAPVEGFLILDLHNLYCQAMNFGIDLMELVHLYPLDKVREIHVSGGSWQQSSYTKQPVRRDTHDENIPEEIFATLEQTLMHCPHCEYVIFERLGHTITTWQQMEDFRLDYAKLEGIITHFSGHVTPAPWGCGQNLQCSNTDTPPIENQSLYDEQHLISHALHTATDATQLRHQLAHIQHWQVEQWELKMIETAMLLSRQWG